MSSVTELQHYGLIFNWIRKRLSL